MILTKNTGAVPLTLILGTLKMKLRHFLLSLFKEKRNGEKEVVIYLKLIGIFMKRHEIKRELRGIKLKV